MSKKIKSAPAAAETVQLTRSEMDAVIIRRVFKGNDALLFAMRAVLLGLGANDSEKKMVAGTFSDAVTLKAVIQRFLPAIRKDDALGNITEVWGGAEKMVFGHSRETIEQALQYKEKGIQMARDAMKLLVNPDLPAPDLSMIVDMTTDPLGIRLLVRNQYIKMVEEQLVGLKIVANKAEDLTPEQRAARSTGDSAE